MLKFTAFGKNDIRGIYGDDITEELFDQSLYTAGLEDPNLVMRTSGEERISNYLLWQLAYAEFIFTPTPWPDFTKERLHECLKEFMSRNRRYGGIKE